MILPLRHFQDDLQCTLMILVLLAVDPKSLSLPNSKIRKILVENNTIMEQGIDKPQLQILDALHTKTKKQMVIINS